MNPTRLLFTLAMVSAFACTGSEEETASTTNPTASSETSESDSDTGEGLDRAVCDRYISCVAVTTPEALPAVKDGFGSDAECWNQSQSEIDICLSACEAGIAAAHEVYPNDSECYLCRADSECDEEAGENCFRGECSIGKCGDGIIQPNEVCDGADGCYGECLKGAECSPLTGVGCGDAEECYLSWGGGIHAFCDDYEALCGEELCETGTYCRYETDMNMEEVLIGCLPYCDKNAPTPCPEGLECNDIIIGPDQVMFEEWHALSYLGRCW